MEDKETTDEGINYSRVLMVERAVSAEADRETLMGLLSKRAPDMSVFDKNPVYFFSGQISSNVYDSYDTRMMASTLQNYAKEAAAGVSFLRGHRSYSTDPIGQSLTGQFVGGQGNGVSRVTSDWYVMRDADSEIFVDRMLAGVVRALSVGFYGGRLMCTICNKDMEQWMLRDGCHHMLGMMYQPRDESGAPTGEPVKCRADIEDAHLAEYSGVFAGSTPGCMIAKARGMAAEGLLRGQERELVQVRYKLILPEHTRTYPAAKPERERAVALDNPNQEDTDMADENKESIRTSKGVLLTVQDVEQHVDASNQIRAALDEVELSKGKPHVEGVRSLITEITRLREIEASVAGIRKMADDGKAYREDLIAETLAEGVRAHGKDFKQEEEKGMLESLPIAAIKRMRDSYKAIGDKLLPGGRATTDEEGKGDPPPPATRKAESIFAYKV